MTSHVPTGRIVGYAYCIKCGLMYLSNEPTKTAIRSGCDPKSILARATMNKKNR